MESDQMLAPLVDEYVKLQFELSRLKSLRTDSEIKALRTKFTDAARTIINTTNSIAENLTQLEGNLRQVKNVQLEVNANPDDLFPMQHDTKIKLVQIVNNVKRISRDEDASGMCDASYPSLRDFEDNHTKTVNEWGKELKEIEMCVNHVVQFDESVKDLADKKNSFAKNVNATTPLATSFSSETSGEKDIIRLPSSSPES